MNARSLDLIFLSAGSSAPSPPAFLGEVTSVDGLAACLELAARSQPDAILIGLSLSDALPIHAVRRLAETVPDSALVIWASHEQEEQALTLVQAGATDSVLYDLMGEDNIASRIDYAIQRHTARGLFLQSLQVKGVKRARPWDWAFELGPDLKFCWLSKEFQERQHLPPDILLGRTPWDIDEIEHDPERWRQYIMDFEARKPFQSLACRTRDSDGARRALRMWGDPAFSPDGEFLGYAGTGVDITSDVESTTRLSDAYELLKDMFDDLQNYRERLEEDLEAARNSQRELLPKQEMLAEIEADAKVRLNYYFEPTSELGGDIWGAVPLGGGRFALYLADFSGHGVAAALNTFRLTTLIQEHDERRDEPAAYLEILNARLKENLPTGQYATMLYGIVDPKAGLFRYAAAASPRPLVADLKTATVEPGEGRGLPLGAVGGAKFQVRELAIKPGSLIMLASDALAESPDVDGKMLGKDGVAELLRSVAQDKRSETNAWSLLDPFFKKVERPLKDDLTVITCQIL
ncbi:MAG: SpoIIE family protein phosphatase [Alphaproteobacteria bacterium]|nr:SpoIIE family protein phosphatase [Alphaproteobacteria bacterium]